MSYCQSGSVEAEIFIEIPQLLESKDGGCRLPRFPRRINQSSYVKDQWFFLLTLGARANEIEITIDCASYIYFTSPPIWLYSRVYKKKYREKTEHFENCRDTRDQYSRERYSPYGPREAPPPPEIGGLERRPNPSQFDTSPALFAGISDGSCSEILKRLVSNARCIVLL